MEHLEQKILNIIDGNQEKIIAFGRDIWTHAELGYKEHRTAKKFADHLKALGVKTQEGLALTGVKGYLKGQSKKGITLALMGELDALPIPNHKDANPETGGAHCCGHNSQLAGVMGSALALTDPEVAKALDGNVVFFAVPAEEYVEIEYREGLMKEGKIAYGGGKTELIRLGAMDDIDMVVGHHAYPDIGVGLHNNSTNGFVNKIVNFKGRSAHAAGAPNAGINALNAATIMMHAIDAQRETFRDQDSVRIHGFFSRGGEAMNIIADTVTMEFSVRAKTMEAVEDASKKFDRSVKAGAVALGCDAEIITVPGYLPVIPANETSVVEDAVRDSAGKYQIQPNAGHSTGSTDYGELSHILPLIQFRSGGFSGILHNSKIEVADEYQAYVLPAKVFALAAYKYLKNGGDRAKAFIESYKQVMDKNTFIRYYESLRKTENIRCEQLPPLK